MERERKFGREFAVEAVVAVVLQEIRRKYGRDGITPLPRHNEAHTWEVITDAGLLADAAIREGKITPEDKELLIVGAACHDIVQEHGPNLNEEASAHQAYSYMLQSGAFSEKEMIRVTNIVRATTIMDSNPVSQDVLEDDYLTKLMADADLASLGKKTNVYWQATLSLFYEKQLAEEVRTSSRPKAPNLIKAAQFGAAFIRAHKFYTPEAENLFPGHGANLQYVQKLALTA